MDNAKLKQEIADAARRRQARAAFGSIIRRHIEELANMDREERIEWLQELEQPSSYSTEISKEISVWIYDQDRG